MAHENTLWTASIALLLALVFGAFGVEAQERVSGDDEAEEVMEMRSKTMKSLGRSMRTLRDFARGRKEASEAAMAASDIEKKSADIPGLFPIGTGLDEFPNSEAKEVIWEEWEEFTAASERLTQTAAAMVAAIESADQGRIKSAFGNLGKKGCGGCHNRFREESD